MGFCEIADIESLLMLEARDLLSATRAIEEATAAIKNYTNQQIELVEDDITTIDGAGLRTKLFLPELPVVGISLITESGLTLVADTDYKLGSWGIVHRLKGLYWEDGWANISITYDHGYATIPQEIIDICTRAASRIYQAGLKSAEQDGIVGIGSYSLGDYSVTFSSEQTGGVGYGLAGVSGSRFLLPWEKELLDKYRYLNRTL